MSNETKLPISLGHACTHYRVFLASSSDLKPERQYLPDVITQVNRSILNLHHIFFDLWAWEKHLEPNLSDQGIQALINPHLSEAAVIIIMVWNRLGPGTNEEFERATALWREHGVRVLLYVCERPSQFLADTELEERRRVLAFLETTKSFATYCPFTTKKELGSLVSKHLTSVAAELHQFSSQQESSQPLAVTPIHGEVTPISWTVAK